MSSETSTDTLQPWQLFTLAGLIGATVVVFMSRGHAPAGIVLLSLTIFAAAVVGLAAWRTFAPFTGTDELAGPQILGGRTRAALEREKALVLRSIKELEFDYAMGKVSNKDFAEMGTRLRVRAAGLMRQLDAGASYREQIEKEVARRVGGQATVSNTANAGRVPRSSAGSGRSEHVEERSGPAVCRSCSTQNDADARFCKHCGAALGGAA